MKNIGDLKSKCLILIFLIISLSANGQLWIEPIIGFNSSHFDLECESSLIQHPTIGQTEETFHNRFWDTFWSVRAGYLFKNANSLRLGYQSYKVGSKTDRKLNTNNIETYIDRTMKLGEFKLGYSLPFKKFEISLDVNYTFFNSFKTQVVIIRDGEHFEGSFQRKYGYDKGILEMIKINSSRLGGTLTIAKQIELLSNFNIRVGCYFSVLSDALIQGSKSFIPYGKVNNFGLEFGLNYLF